MHLQENIDAGLNIDQIAIFLLLFADDAVLISESKDGLQNSLNSLYTYCEKWNMTVNIDKTKVMIFRKGGRVGVNDKWSYNNKEVEIVKSFNYLGVVFTSGGSFALAMKTLARKKVCDPYMHL